VNEAKATHIAPGWRKNRNERIVGKGFLDRYYLTFFFFRKDFRTSVSF